MSYRYLVYGAVIESEIPLSFFLLNEDVSHKADACIKLSSISREGLQDFNGRGLYYQVNHHEFWLHVPNIAYFLVRNGQEILIDMCPGVDLASVEVFLVESCLGMLMAQRQHLVLSASVLNINQRGVMFLGSHINGKSALIGNLMGRGNPFVSDRVSVLDMHFNAIPGRQCLELSELALMPEYYKHLKKIREGFRYYYVPVGNAFSQQKPLKIELVYVLQFQQSSKMKVSTLLGVQKIQHFLTHVFKPSILKHMDVESFLFENFAQHMSGFKMVLIELPNIPFEIYLNQVTELILNDIHEKMTEKTS